MNWFQRHLNWILVLSFVANCLIIMMICALTKPAEEPLISSISDVGYLLGIWAVSTSVPLVLGAQFYTDFIIYFLIPASWFLASCGWVLYRKRRSLWWLLLPFFIPLGWIVILCLKNRR